MFWYADPAKQTSLYLIQLPKAVERFVDDAIGQRSETCHAQVDADNGVGDRQRVRHRPFGLDGHDRASGFQRDSEIPLRSFDGPAVVMADPANLGRVDPTVGLVDLALLGARVAEAVALTTLLKAWEGGSALEIVV